MPLIPIDSWEDPRLAPYRNLKASNDSRTREYFVAEGEKLLQRLLAAGLELDSVLASTTYATHLPAEVSADVPVYVIAHECLEQLVGFNFHRGVLSRGRRRLEPTLQTFLSERAGPLLLVICPDIKDPENLGAIIRNSSGFGVDAIILGPQAADPFSRRVLRVSMGTVFRIPILESSDLAADIELLRQTGVELGATVLDDRAESLATARRPERFGLLFGNEGHGLEARWIERCHRRITIPMPAGTDSLNVAVATGIFLYHFTHG